jgi:LacI family transcriptional regulator
VETRWMVECIPNRLDAVAQSEQLFTETTAPTAAVCYNDAVALGLMLGLHQRGLQPGRDFALTGFDDIAEAAVSAPPLTTLAVTPRARGRQAAELILQRLQEPSASPRQTIVPVQLLVRASSCAPHAA